MLRPAPMPRMSPSEWREITGLRVPGDYGENYHRPDGEHMLEALLTIPIDLLSDDGVAVAQSWLSCRERWYKELERRLLGLEDDDPELGDLEDMPKNGAPPILGGV